MALWNIVTPSCVERVPNYFMLPLIETEPQGAVKWIFNSIRRLPSRIQTRVLTFLHLPLGAWKSLWSQSETGTPKKYTLVDTDFWKDTVVYLPAMLHKKYEEEHSSQAIEVRIPFSRKRSG